MSVQRAANSAGRHTPTVASTITSASACSAASRRRRRSTGFRGTGSWSAMRAGGLVRTALRASDILIDRVWQLETETFRDTPTFAFARITEIIDPEQDPTALHPEVQRQLSTIRTDLDRFSEVEIANLMRHGY